MCNSTSNAAAYAALAICEALLITLVEDEVVDRERVQEILEDAAEAHEQTDRVAADRPTRERAARLIEEIVISLNAIAEGRRA